MSDPLHTPYTRVFTVEDRAGPVANPLYQGQAKATGPNWSFGDVTPVREPDDSRYGAFKTIGTIRGEQDLPTVSLMSRYQYTLSELLRLARKGCQLDIQIHAGKCQDPRDFNGGWDKILVLEGATTTTWSTGDLGAYQQGEDAIVDETGEYTGLDMYEIKRLAFSALAGSQISNEIVDVEICDSITCGACGIASDGCSAIFAIQLRNTGSPGLPAELIASRDGGATIIESEISTLPTNMDPSALACVGTRLAIVSNGDCAIHYANIADILNSVDVWVRNASGLTCPTGAPNDLFSRGARFTWVVGNGGYVYFYSDITGAAVTQDAGVATAQNLNAVDFFDDLNGVAVGASNAVIYTRNGTSWASITGPAVGVALNAVKMLSADIWLIGTAGGKLFYTRNGGTTWTEKTFPGSGSGAVQDIRFATPTVGYMSHTLSGAGRVLRTVDGGSSWYVLPEGTGAIPTNQRINALAACDENPNVVYGGGLGAATDGQLVKAS